MKKLVIASLSLLSSVIIFQESGYGEPTLPGEPSQVTPIEVFSVIGAYTDEELETALDDYFNVTPLGAAQLHVEKRIDAIFETGKIPQIDESMHRFIFDNALTRQDKLAALFSVFRKSAGNSDKQRYILDTLSAFKPIELTDLLIREYRECRDIENARSIFRTLESASLLGSVGYTKLRPEQLRYASFMTEKIYQVAKQETRVELLPLTQGMISDEEVATSPIHSSDSLKADGKKAISGFQSIEDLLGSAELTSERVAHLRHKLEEIKDPEERQSALNILYSAVREVPFSDESKKLLRPIVEKYGPKAASVENLIGYIEWLRAYASVLTLTNDDTEAYRSVFREKFISGTVDTKLALLLYAGECLTGLTPQDKAAARAAISEYAGTLPDKSPEKRISSVALSEFDKRIP
jgi:hypothetical protein